MKRIIVSFMISLLIIPLICTKSYAVGEEATLVKIDSDYAIYINNYEDKEFEFAFTNDTTLTESNVQEQLTFIKNWTDTNNINIACLEDSSAIDKMQPVIMWIKHEENLFSIELKLDESITKEEMNSIEMLTKNIKVSTENQSTKLANENGVTITETVGQIDITDSDEYDYKYQLIKIDGNESKNAKEIISMVDDLQNSYSSLTMYNKIEATKTIKKLYNALKEEGTWSDVENKVIYQPLDSVEGDQYIVLLQQLSNGEIEKEDIQFLICTNGHNEEYVKDVNVVKQTSTLPVTYDSVILLVILLAVLIIAIAVIIRMKKLKEENNEK